MIFAPYYHDRAPNKDVQNHFKENGGVQAYTAWKNKMNALSVEVLGLLNALQSTNKSTGINFAKLLGESDQNFRSDVIESIKKAFSFLAHDENYVNYKDARNEQAVTYIKAITATDYEPKTALDCVDIQNVSCESSVELENAMSHLNISHTVGFDTDSLAAIFSGELSRCHRTHQQSIIRNIHTAFGLLPSFITEELNAVEQWAIRAGRGDFYFPYI